MSRKIEQKVSLESISRDEVDPEIQSLVDKAKEAAEKAHAPYSNFLVGAAVLLDNGEIFTGNNQENVAFPAGICAERVVLSYAQANFPSVRPVKLVVVARRRDTKNYSFVSPCGTCRQTISEYEQKFKTPIELYMLNSDGELLKASGIDDLLPFKFIDF